MFGSGAGDGGGPGAGKPTGPAYGGYAGGSSPSQQRKQDNNNFNIKRRNNKQQQHQQQQHQEQFNSNLISFTPPKSSLINYRADSDQATDGHGGDGGRPPSPTAGHQRLVAYLRGGGGSIGDGDAEEHEKQEFLTGKDADVKQPSKRTKSISSPQPLKSSSATANASKSHKAKLARQETSLIDEEDREGGHRQSSCACRMLRILRQKRFLIPILLVIIYIVAVYCVPFVEFEPRIAQPWPSIPFNYKEGPLKASSASQFKVEHLFKNQIHGPESMALDSMGNMYLAIEGGFVLYAHLNKSSAVKRHYYQDSIMGAGMQTQPSQLDVFDLPNLVKIAELNGVKQFVPKRTQRDNNNYNQDNNNNNNRSPVWRRECQLDEQIYGSQLYSPTSSQLQQLQLQEQRPKTTKQIYQNFVSHVPLSRCSKPLGVRLSSDENYLYIVDTFAGLYRVNLRQAERPYSTQRLVTRLIAFGNHMVVPLDIPAGDPSQQQLIEGVKWMNVTMKAIDDLVVVPGAGSKSSDVIYMTVASQNWPALSFVYDHLEGRPSGLILRYDVGANQLVALDPNKVAHVRTSTLELIDGEVYHRNNNNSSSSSSSNNNNDSNLAMTTTMMTPYNFGSPRMDENDIFDDRPLNFPNGIEITDDRQALLIADTSNKRIIKHYINGPRRGTSDLWAWTPNFPDNIRRGYDRTRSETYWVVGCGRDESQGFHVDAFSLLQPWPRVRKFLVKNMYLFGTFVEWMGTNLIRSTNVRDFGYSVKTGSSLCENGCSGMMIVQYNQNGELIRSIHSREFPNDLTYYSQVNEVIDANNQEHVLYLGSPSYRYVTKLTLPTESYDSPPLPRPAARRS